MREGKTVPRRNLQVSFRELTLSALVLILGTLTVSSIAFGWTPPGFAPPNGNVTLSGVPAGTIAFFTGACPSGWSEYTALRGRVLAGTPSGGTDTGTVGTPLANLGSRTTSEVAAHTHSVDPPSTASGANSAGHTHSVDPPSTASGANSVDHTHSVDPPSTALSLTDPGHVHGVPLGDGGSGASIGAYPGQANTLGTQNTNSNSTGMSGSVNIAAFTSAGASVTHTHTTDISSFTSAGESATHTHATDIAAFTSVSTGTASVDITMPYIQLRACQKS
jgi:hypothetical protein